MLQHGMVLTAPELWMTLGIVVVGFILFLTLAKMAKTVRYSTTSTYRSMHCMIPP